MQKLEAHTFNRSARESSYDWDTLLDGGIYQLSKGDGADDDFDCEVITFQALARNAAKRKNESQPDAAQHIGVRTQTVKGDTKDAEGKFEDVGLIIQAVPASTLPKRERKPKAEGAAKKGGKKKAAASAPSA